MPAVLLFVALLLPQQVVPQTSAALRGRLILASNNPNTVRHAESPGLRSANEAVEMVRAPELLILGDPLWPGSIGRAAVSYGDPVPVAQASAQHPGQPNAAAMTYGQITAARRARGAGDPPALNFGTPDFSRPREPGDQLALRDRKSSESQAGPASLREAPRSGLATVTAMHVDRTSAEAASDEGLPVAYQVEDKSGAFEVQQVTATETMPQRIVQTDETTLYFSGGVPVYLRHTPKGQGGCYLEYDFGLDGHRTILGNAGYWLEAPAFGGVALHWAGQDHLKLDLSHASVPGCQLPAELNLHRSGRNWEAR